MSPGLPGTGGSKEELIKGVGVFDTSRLGPESLGSGGRWARGWRQHCREEAGGHRGSEVGSAPSIWGRKTAAATRGKAMEKTPESSRRQPQRGWKTRGLGVVPEAVRATRSLEQGPDDQILVLERKDEPKRAGCEWK